MRIRRLLIAALIGIVIAAGLVPILIAENTLHIWAPRRPDPLDADRIAGAPSSAWQSAQITAADGARLDAWLFTPRDPNGSAVILLHGVADTRSGVLYHAQYLLQAGFIVLAPDSRGHGASGGARRVPKCSTRSIRKRLVFGWYPMRCMCRRSGRVRRST